jgi:hypothetical protein
MRVNNQSNSEVHWNQSGSNPQPEDVSSEDQSGDLVAGQETDPFTPTASEPWWVVFSNGHKPVVSDDIRDANATVTLTAAWKIEIT